MIFRGFIYQIRWGVERVRVPRNRFFFEIANVGKFGAASI